jgi:hypothetical protein
MLHPADCKKFPAVRGACLGEGRFGRVCVAWGRAFVKNTATPEGMDFGV